MIWEHTTQCFCIFRVHTGVSNMWLISKNTFLDIFRCFFASKQRFEEEKIRLWARSIYAVFKSPKLCIDRHFLVQMILYPNASLGIAQGCIAQWASLHLGINVCDGKAAKQYFQHIWHIKWHIQQNFHIPFGYQLYQVLVYTPGSLIPSLTDGRTLHTRRSPIQVLMHLIDSSITGILYFGTILKFRWGPEPLSYIPMHPW